MATILLKNQFKYLVFHLDYSSYMKKHQYQINAYIY